MKKIKVKKGGKSIFVEAKQLTPFGKFLGLMFRSKNCENLLFDFSTQDLRGIHSYFVFFPFMAIWLDEKNNIIDYSLVRPFKSWVEPKKPFKRLIEAPLNSRNGRILEMLVGKGKV